PLATGKSFDMAVAAGSGSGSGQSKGDGSIIVGRSEKNDLSLPLRWVPVYTPSASKIVLEIKNRLLPSSAPKQDASFRDPVLQDSPFSNDISVTPEIPATTQNFDGVDNVNGVLPPDTNGDVGLNHYVQTVNLSYAVYNKSGTKLLGPNATNSIWA